MAEDFIRTLRRGCAAPISVLLLVGCGDEGRRVAGPLEVRDPAQLVAWVSATPLAFRAGETVQIEAGIRNPTTRPIVVGFSSGCRLLYAVEDESGVHVAPDFICTQDAPTYALAPGETISQSFAWDGRLGGVPLPPGEYRVRGWATTKPVTIRILAP